MDILFIDRSTKVKSAKELYERPRGGTVNSLFEVSDYLSRQGHEVHVLSDIESPGYSICGTAWFNEPVKDHYDAVIMNRGIGDGYPSISAKKRILWTHDLCHSGFIPEPKLMKAIHTVFMSLYSMSTWREFYRDINKYSIIPNGVDDSKYGRHLVNKRQDKVIYFSHPNRGLSRLPLIADAVNARVKREIEFVAYSGECMYPNEHGFSNDDNEFSLNYSESNHLKIEKPINSRLLSDKIKSSSLMIMPTGIPETCANTVLQSLACGTPVITTGNLGSMGEWVKHRKNGMLTNRIPNDYMIYTMEIVRNVVEVLENPELHRKLIKGAFRTKIHSWDEIGRKWEKLITR